MQIRVTDNCLAPLRLPVRKNRVPSDIPLMGRRYPNAWEYMHAENGCALQFFLSCFMAVIMSQSIRLPAYKRQRRNATAVLAGCFDPHASSSRDVLTSLLNGVPLYKEVERDQVSRREKKREKRERDRERKRVKAAEKSRQLEPSPEPTASSSTATVTVATAQPKTKATKTSSFWRARPTIHIATDQRSMSVTPPPMPLSPQSTPGRASSSTSVTSSKRPRTPDDDEDLDISTLRRNYNHPPPDKKRRVAVKKGWKGWIEGSPPPSEKLINLDEVKVLNERKTRSGKSFDGIGLAKEDWI